MGSCMYSQNTPEVTTSFPIAHRTPLSYPVLSRPHIYWLSMHRLTLPSPGLNRYLKVIDKFFNNYISCFVTGANVKFLLLHQPFGGSSSSGSSRSSTSIAANPTSAATEEAIKSFFLEVYENWVKAVMNPFYKVNMEVKSPIFRQRVFAAGRKYL